MNNLAQITFDYVWLVFFADEDTIDLDYSEDEDRFILLGISVKLRILVVCHCFRESSSAVRLISARKADKDEEQEYWKRGKS